MIVLQILAFTMMISEGLSMPIHNGSFVLSCDIEDTISLPAPGLYNVTGRLPCNNHTWRMQIEDYEGLEAYTLRVWARIKIFSHKNNNKSCVSLTDKDNELETDGLQYTTCTSSTFNVTLEDTLNLHTSLQSRSLVVVFLGIEVKYVCGGDVTEDTVIEAPEISPGRYCLCTWAIKVPDERKVLVHILTTDLGRHELTVGNREFYGRNPINESIIVEESTLLAFHHSAKEQKEKKFVCTIKFIDDNELRNY
ncbi:uncharacterized protein LOC143025272 [Oratosquilla oratoria]|uniref:uncharacterized protein LOC143025272 n=1 Tax=Oratosquilla oratoria TaxID=337810 RepID=UPI003F77110C